jgi:hypothetical protein
MRLLVLSLPPFLFVTVPALVAGGFILRGRRRLPWHTNGLVLVPFLVWAATVALTDSGKSLSNLFREPILLGLIVGLSHSMFLAWPGPDRARALKRLALSIAFCSVAALGLAGLHPILPE